MTGPTVALLRDLAHESVASLTARPSRLLLASLGPVLGVMSLVGTLGVAASAAQHIVTRFDELAATQVRVEPATDQAASALGRQPPLPWQPETTLEPLNGVVAAGSVRYVQDAGEVTVSARRGQSPLRPPTARLAGGSTHLRAAVQGTLAAGRWFDRGHGQRRDLVAVLGAAVASRLGIHRLDARPAVLVNGVPVTVIGILGSVGREPELLQSVIMPEPSLELIVPEAPPDAIYIDTDIGAAEQIAEQAPVALSARFPDAYVATRPAEPRDVRAQVDADTQSLFVVLGVLALLVGGLVIANSMTVAVVERRGEIGLRRSLGAARATVAAQFLLESTAVGLVGGVAGASLGTIATVAVSAVQGWVPVMNPWLPLLGPVLGGLLGMLAGSYPAWRAASLDPIAALRGH